MQQPDVLDGQLQDLALAQLFVGRVRRKQPPQVRESAAHVLLPEPLAVVGKDFADAAAAAAAADRAAEVRASNPGRSC